MTVTEAHHLTEALDALPPAYADVVRLRAAGVDDAAIARQLGVPNEAVRGLVELAARKLCRALRLS